MEKARILLIDDDTLFLTLTKAKLDKVPYLESIGCVKHAKDAREYLDSCVEKQEPFPDAIFLDINMPGIGGMDFADLYSRRYADQYPDTKLVILTSFENPDDKLQALDNPAISAFIQKPLTEEKLNTLLL